MTQDPGSATPMSERMQSLLSRAVEDQLSEQRQLAGALTEVRTQLTRLVGQLNAMQAAPGGSSEQLEQGLAGLATDVREAVRLLGERLEAVGRQVQQRGSDLAELRALIIELKASVDGHTGALASVTSGLTALPAFGERIDALQNGLAGLHERLRGIEELSAASTGMQAQAQAHDVALRELRQAFTGVAARAAQLPVREDIEALLTRSAEPLDALGNRLGRIEASMPSLLDRLNELSDQMTEHGEGLAGVRERLAAVSVASPDDRDGDQRAEAMESLASVQRRLDELHERAGDSSAMDELTSRLDELHEGLFGAEGLHAQVSALAVGSADAVEDDEDVHELVARAVEDSERRLTNHIDQAVLALAEALLRRRGSRPTGRLEARATAAIDVPAVTEVAEEIEDEAADGADEAADAEAVAEETDDFDDVDDVPDLGDARPAGPARWQTPAAPPAAAPPEPPPVAKRKPWWRPGD